jgi:predicted lysophospholipase L1 biosynthesis ABC-type transport system permease subunit
MPGENNSSQQTALEAGINRIHLPFSTVVQITMNSLKIRFWRSMVTASGIFLGIAFLSYVSTNLLTSEGQGIEERARLVWLVVMSLLVSTVGIVNSMLMSVTERFREIGTMKCLGAPDDFVVKLFFVEAVFTGAVSSVGGWVVGYLGSVIAKSFSIGLIHSFQAVGAVRTLELAVGCIVIGVFVTLIATIAPARSAAAMPAAAALRTEV